MAALAISDSNGKLLFTAKLTGNQNATYFASTPLVSGTGVKAKGGAQIQASALNGVVNGALSVTAAGLPPSTTYTYAVDGKDIGKITTGSKGSLKLIATEKPVGGTLPKGVNLFTVANVTGSRRPTET